MKKNVFLFLFIPLLISITKAEGVDVNDSLALVALYNQLNGPNWYYKTNWLKPEKQASVWYGITVENERVTAVHLTDNNLSGTIPLEIKNLTNLTELDLSWNKLKGIIPEEIGNLTSLTMLDISDNSLSGKIPSAIGNLTGLIKLDLSGNFLTGTIPPEIKNLTSLKGLYISSNSLSGNIPVEIGDLTDLIELFISWNAFTGNLPIEIKNLSNMEWFYIQNNFFTFSHLENVSDLYLYEFNYSPQWQVQMNTNRINKNTGDDLELDITTLAIPDIVADKNQYQWWKDSTIITKYSKSSVLSIPELDNSHQGYYYCTMKNSYFPLLTLFTDSILVILNGPEDIIVSHGSVDENITSGSVVGTLSAKDADDTSGHTFVLLQGDGINDRDNTKFSIKGTNLIINAVPDYETQQEYRIYLHVTDKDSKAFSKALVISVSNLNDPPVIEDQSFFIDDKSPGGTVVGTVTAIDDDSDELGFSFISGNDNDVFAIDSISGEIAVSKPSELDYAKKKQFTLTIQASDETNTGQGIITIHVSSPAETHKTNTENESKH